MAIAVGSAQGINNQIPLPIIADTQFGNIGLDGRVNNKEPLTRDVQ